MLESSFPMPKQTIGWKFLCNQLECTQIYADFFSYNSTLMPLCNFVTQSFYLNYLRVLSMGLQVPIIGRPLLEQVVALIKNVSNKIITKTKKVIKWGAAIAQWIHLRLPSCRPNIPSMLLTFIVKFVLYLPCEKNENKQKVAPLGP